MVENKKSLAEQLYEAGYNTYKEDPRETVPHWESSNGIDTDALLSDLREARNSRPSEERILTENPEYNVLSEIGDMGAHLLRQMNDAQIGEANGELVTDVLPNIDRIQNNLKLFEEFDNTNNQINQVRAALSVEQDDQTISELQNTYNDLLNKQAEQKKQLVSLGVAPNLSNAQDIISQQESELKNLQTRADKLYKSIETDEADKSRYDVSNEYLNASQASEFKWTEPSTWRYTLPGVVGSSAGSWMWQIAPYATSLIKNVAKKALAKAAVGAAAGSVVPGAGTAAGGVTGALIGVGSAAITAVDAGVMLYSNWKQSESETYSELFDGYKQKISEQLANAGITPAIVVDLAKEAGISEQFSNLSDNEIFDKILNGQIPVQIPELNAALQEARRGLNQRYRTNQAITFGTDVMQDAIMLSSWGNKLKTGRKLLGTVLDPVGGVTDLAGDAAKKHLRKYVLGRNAIDKEARKWLSRGAKAGYVGADLGLRALANAVSEGAEEGGQYRNNKEYLAGAFNDKDDLNLQHVGEALLKAYEVKGKAAWDIVASPFGLTDPLYENDTEYWQNIKLGAAASLFSPLSVASNVMGINTTVKELQGMDKVNDLAAAEVNAKDNVEKAIIYSGDSYKGRESEVVNAWLTLANGPKENLPEGFTKEDILEEAQFASRVFNLKSNKSIQAVANALRIDTNSSEYGELLGIFMQSEDELKATNKSKNEAERELDTRVRNMANDPVFGTMFEAAVNSVVDEAKTVDKEVPQEAIASLLGLRREMDVIDNMLSDIETLSVMSKEDGLDSYYGGNVYTKTKLEDFKYRLRTRQKALQTAYNNAIKPYKETSNVVEQAVDRAARMTAVDEINELTEKAVFARMNAERAQEVYRSFLDAGPVTLTEALKSREIKQAAASTKKSKKQKKLKLKALRNIHDNQGIKLIEELFELYQTKKQESRELNEGVSGIVTPTTTTPVVDSSITISPLSEPTPSEEPQPINPTQPRPTSVSSTSPITTEDEIDPWAGATTDVDSLLSEADAALAEAEVQPVTESPVVVPESTEIENTEEPLVDVADDDPWQDTELRDSAPDTATPSSKSKKDKAKEEFDQAASELKDAFDDLLNLGFAYDPARDAEKQAKVFTAFLKFLGKAFNLGKYKFQEVALQFCEFLGGGKAKLEPYFNAFKGAYTTAYYSMPTEEQTKMTNPGDVAVITLDSLFDAAPESDLTEEELADALASGAVTYRKDELPSDAITDAQLAEFNENTDLGILNTFHYRHDSNVKGETLLFNGKAIEFAPNAELPDLLNNPNSNLTFEYSVAPFIEYKTGRSRIDWSNPATYDWARVGMIVTDENTGKHYWIAMRAPKQLLTSAEFEERRDLIQKLRKARQEIIEKFVIRDDNGNLTNRVTYKSKVKPSRILIHSAVSNTVRTFPMIDSRFSQAFKLESNLDEEINNFAYSDGRNGTGSIYRLNGDNTGFSSTTYGGLYYIIDSSKTRSGRTLPIKVNTAKLNSVDGLANLLSRIIFESGFNNANKVEGTSLIGTDIINLFLNYGNPTTVSNQEQEQDSSILDNLKNKQLYIANSALHYGKNTVRISGLSAEQKEKERKAFEDWLNANINIAFKVPSEKNQIDVTMPLSKMFNGRLAESVNNAGGSLNLLGFNITNEDLNKSWLAFLLKHGLINSDLDAERYSRPYVIAEGIIKTAEPKTTVSPNTPEISKVEEQPKTEEKPEVKQRRTVRSVRANFSVPGKVNFTPNKKYESKKKLNSTNAKKFLREKLGLNDSEIDVINVIISSEKPTTALSYMTKDAITLYSSDPLGTEYHEGYHRVSLLLLNEKQRNALYKEYREKNPFAKKLSDKEVEELMAEDFRAFALNKDATQSSFIRRWYEKLKDFVNSLIGSKINKLYRGIYEGKYKNIPVNEESKRRFEEVYGGKANFTQHGHKYENIKSLDNYYQAVEYLANTYINKALDESQNSSDITKINIDFEDMRDLLDDFSYDEELTSEQRAALKELHDNFDGVRQDVESYLQSLNLKKLQDEEEYESNEERDGGEIEKDNFDKYDRASYEVSILHSIRPAVKLFLSSIEEVQVSGNNATQDVNKETGLPVVTSFVSSWLRITSKLFGEETFEGLIARSAELAQRDDFFVSFYNRLINVRDTNLQTQILHTITGFKHNFLTVGFQEITDENDNISYAADLGGSVRQRYAKKVVSDWNKNFFESDLITVDASGNRTPNKPKLKKLLDSYNDLVKQISKVNESTITEEEISKILASYASLLNEIGINVTSDTLYQAIEAKAEVKNSVNHNSFFKTLKELLVNNSSGSLSRAIPDILKNPVKTGRINRTIDAVFSSEPSILNLAMVYYEMNRNTAEEKVLGPKNTAVYPMSKHNYLTLEIKKLNKDRNYVKDLMKCPINAASMILKALKKDSTLTLTPGTLLNITEYYSGSSGTDYQSAPRVETFISKLVLSENDILLLPTMSDKKTYMPIQGIRLFSGRTLEVTSESGSIKIRFSNDVLDQFAEYYRSEYEAIKQYYLIKSQEDKVRDENRPTRYFGTRGKDNGRGGKFRICKGLYIRNEEGQEEYVNFNKLLEEGSFQEVEDYFNNAVKLKEDINRTLLHNVDSTIDYAKKLGLISHNNGFLQNAKLPIGYVSKRADTLGANHLVLSGDANSKLRNHIAVFDLLSAFTVNQFVSMFEAEKILYKDSAFFKNYADVSKRLAGVLSTGTVPRTDFSDPNHIMNRVTRYKQGRYNVAGLKDIELRTNQPVELYNAIYKAYVREYLENETDYTKEKIDNIFETSDLFTSEEVPESIRNKARQNTERDLSLYGDVKMDENGKIMVNEDETPINQADASVYCSPQMYKAILASIGELTPEVEEAIDYLEQYADTGDLKDIRKYMSTLSAVISPKKMIYFGNEILSPIAGQYINMPIFNKMAIFPLFKVLATGDIRHLYDRMNDPINPIDMFTTSSAVKVGNIVEYDFYTDSTQKEITDEFKKNSSGGYDKPITYRQQNFRNLLDQMPIAAHEAEKRMLVTQAMKTVFSNLRQDGDYFLPSLGKSVSGKELVKYAMDAINDLSDRGLNRLLKQFHAEKTTTGYKFKDLDGLSEKLVYSLISSNADTDILEQVSLNEDGEFNVPLSVSPLAKKLVSNFISAINKETVDINLPGGTFIQMSSFGLKREKLSQTEAETKGILINNGERLKLVNDDNSMDCVISINLLKHFIPDYENKTFAESRQWLIDNKIIGPEASPSAMAYRVPTQGMSSIAALSIRDVVMSQAGDIIILPDEFTARTGSDKISLFEPV